MSSLTSLQKQLEAKRAKLKALRDEKERIVREKEERQKKLHDNANNVCESAANDQQPQQPQRHVDDCFVKSLSIYESFDNFVERTSIGHDLMFSSLPVNTTTTTTTTIIANNFQQIPEVDQNNNNSDNNESKWPKNDQVLPKEMYSKSTQTCTDLMFPSLDFDDNCGDDNQILHENDHETRFGCDLEWEGELSDLQQVEICGDYNFGFENLILNSTDRRSDGDDDGDDDDDDEPVTVVTTAAVACRTASGSETDEIMDANEQQRIVESPEFRQFLNRTAPIVERALSDPMDILIDYSVAKKSKKTTEDVMNSRILLNREFYDETLIANHPVTSLDHSTHFPELHLASYMSSKVDNYWQNESDGSGYCLVWNRQFTKKMTPEYAFRCQSSVTSAIFSRFHPNLIFGATYAGQIVMWDSRDRKRTPVQRSLLKADAHTQPIYSLKMTGTQNDRSLISMSMDGTICVWSLEMFAYPQERIKIARQTNDAFVTITCADFVQNDVNRFLIGSEEGHVHTVVRRSAAVKQPAESESKSFRGHYGPITALACHHQTAHDSLRFPHLFLTSSFDSSVRLWTTTPTTNCLHTLDIGFDYVTDVAWSPTHPAVFAACSSSGRIDVYNLNRSIAIPCATTVTDTPRAALNKLSWTESGLGLLAGDSTGHVHVYDLSEEFFSPRNNDWEKFAKINRELYNEMIHNEMEKSGKFD